LVGSHACDSAACKPLATRRRRLCRGATSSRDHQQSHFLGGGSGKVWAHFRLRAGRLGM